MPESGAARDATLPRCAAVPEELLVALSIRRRNGAVPVTHQDLWLARGESFALTARATAHVAARARRRGILPDARAIPCPGLARRRRSRPPRRTFFPPFFPAGSPGGYGGSRFQVKPPTRARGFRSRVANAEQTERSERPPVFHTSRRAARTARRTFSQVGPRAHPGVRPAPSSSSSSRSEAKKANSFVYAEAGSEIRKPSPAAQRLRLNPRTADNAP